MLRPVRRVRVFLGVSNIPDDQIDDFAEGKGWAFVAKNVDGIWLNTAGSGLKTAKGKDWLAEAISQTSGDVFSVQNIGTADILKSLHNSNPKFKEWKASGQPHVPGDGYGREAGVGASNNALLLLRNIVKAGGSARVVGANVVTDYICGHECLPDEDWRASDVDVAAAKLAAGLPQESAPGISPPLFVSTRNGWWYLPKTKVRPERDGVDPKVLPILRRADGFVFESAPTTFLEGNRVDLQIKGMRNAVWYAREQNKPLVWLAPKGSSTNYLGDMQKAMQIFERNQCVPDAVVVINYSPGGNAPFPMLPDNRGGKPVNTVSGVARFLIDTYGGK